MITNHKQKQKSERQKKGPLLSYRKQYGKLATAVPPLENSVTDLVCVCRLLGRKTCQNRLPRVVIVDPTGGLRHLFEYRARNINRDDWHARMYYSVL